MMTKPHPEPNFLITLKGHPMNAWFLHIVACGYVEIDDGEPVALGWNRTTRFQLTNPGVHKVRFILKYFNKFTVHTRTFEPHIKTGETFTLHNGWSNQHPFILENDDQCGPEHSHSRPNRTAATAALMVTVSTALVVIGIVTENIWYGIAGSALPLLWWIYIRRT